MSKTIKTTSYLLIFILVSIFISSCNMIFIPKYQKITFKTNSDENEVYLDEELVCKGKSNISKIDKKAVKGQIVVLRKGYKPIYDVILRAHRPKAFYPLLVLDIPLYYPVLIDCSPEQLKLQTFDKEILLNTLPEESLLPVRKKNEKYLDVTNISIKIKDHSKDIVYINSKHSDDLKKSLKLSEDEFYQNRLKEDEKLAAKKLKEKKGKKLESEENDLKIQLDDTKLSTELIKILKQTNYIDTVNKIFKDQNNTLVLEASIKKITHFIISARWTTYCKTKLNITWYLKNTYDEKLDSVEVSDFSGNYFYKYIFENAAIFDSNLKISDEELSKAEMKSISDAFLNSYLNLTKKKSFVENLKLNNLSSRNLTRT